MGTPYIISIDLGTTGNRVFCFSEAGKPIASAYRELTQHFPKPGWVEHDPLDIWNSVSELIPAALHKGGLSAADARAIGITNQRETTVLWRRKTGLPVYPAIVWQCRRTASMCQRLKEQGHEELFHSKTGLILDAYFSGTKLQWMLDTVPDARRAAEAGELAFGTIDSWILWNLSGGAHKTDYTNASRTLMYNIMERRWDEELLSLLTIPPSLLPEVCESASRWATTKNAPGLPDGILIGGIAGDQQAAMVGQNCVHGGSSKCTYGTGGFILTSLGDRPRLSRHGLLTTLCCDTQGRPNYALEGSVFIAGAVVQWLRDYMGFFDDAAQSEQMAEAADSDDAVVVVPAFVGIGAPYWNMQARGAIFGLTRDTSREQITRAALRAIAFQTNDIIDCMQEESGTHIRELRVDGGVCNNRYVMQFQADISDCSILVPEITESTALGAAYLAGLSAGLYASIDEVARNNTITHRYLPLMPPEQRQQLIARWRNAVQRLI